MDLEIVQFATLLGNPILTASDFVVIWSGKARRQQRGVTGTELKAPALPGFSGIGSAVTVP